MLSAFYFVFCLLFYFDRLKSAFSYYVSLPSVYMSIFVLLDLFIFFYLTLRNRFICQVSSTGNLTLSSVNRNCNMSIDARLLVPETRQKIFCLVSLTPPRRTAVSSTHIKPPPSTHGARHTTASSQTNSASTGNYTAFKIKLFF